MKKNRDEPRRPFKNFNFTRLTVRALIIFLFISISFACSYWRDEGTLGPGAIRNLLAQMFSIFQVPALTILYDLGFYTWTYYVIGLLINAYLYAIVIGIILKLLSKLRKKKEPKEISMR